MDRKENCRPARYTTKSMDSNLKPKVSIQMCTYNRAHFIEDAIKSVLDQNFKNWELLILDDASTDETEKIVFPYLADKRIRYIKNKDNLGITKNRNKGLSLSNGECIAVLDSDDYWTDSTKLEKQILFLDENKEYFLVGTNMRVVNENRVSIKKASYPLSDSEIRSKILIKNPFCHSSVVYRKDKVFESGNYDETLPIWEDYDLWLKLGLKGKFANLDMFGATYRKHHNQSDSNKKLIALRTQRILIEKYKQNYKHYKSAICVHLLRRLRAIFL